MGIYHVGKWLLFDRQALCSLTGQLSAISPQHMHAWFLTILQQQCKKLSFAQPQGSNGLLLF
jgi:hypothetical protein